MSSGRAVGILAVGVVMVTAAYLSAWHAAGVPVWGNIAMVAGCAVTLAAMLHLGARRSGVRPRTAMACALFLAVVVGAGFGIPFLLPVTAHARLFLGLPFGAACEIFGVGLLPFLVLPMIYATTFRREPFEPEALAALRARADALRAQR